MAEIRVYIEKDQVSLLLDLSGDPLFKRGYRTEGGIAPLRETTAAAIILSALWKRKYPLYDPFCGSGTIIREAAMYALDLAPGLARHFALEKLLLADKTVERQVREEAAGRIDLTRVVRIAGSDADSRAVAAANANLRRALAAIPQTAGAGRNNSSGPLPSFCTLPMEEARFTGSGDDAGYIITNPPYGKRLGDSDAAEKIYGQMNVLARNFPGWKLGVITDHPGFESFFGKKADSCREITNGKIDTFFYQYGIL
jgi:putative N6-adenine-specific DNA methylase